MQREDLKLNSDRCSGRTCHRETPPQLQPPAPTQLFSPGHWGEEIQSHTRGAGPARHAWRGPRRRSRRRLMRKSRAPDLGEMRGLPGELRGRRGQRQQRSKAPRLLGGRAFTGVRGQLHAEIWLKGTRDPSRPPPLKLLEGPGSRDLKTREDGSPAHDDVTDAAVGGR